MADTSRTRPPPPKPPPYKPVVSSSKPGVASRPGASSRAAEDAAPSSSKLGWLIGWIVVPAVLLSVVFFLGVHVGAHNPQMWLARATLWMFDREPQLGPASDADREPMARRLRLATLPRKDHSIEVDITEAELAKIAEDSGLSPATLDCETVCRSLWLAKNPEREFLGATHCKVTPPEEVEPPATRGPAKLECDAKVQR